MNIDLTEIILALIGILGAVITGYAMPWLKSKAGDARWHQLEDIAKVAVHAAEQLGISKQIEDCADYALKQARITLKAHGLTFDDETIKAAIEAQVLHLPAAVVVGQEGSA